jgi:protein SCO1/2
MMTRHPRRWFLGRHSHALWLQVGGMALALMLGLAPRAHAHDLSSRRSTAPPPTTRQEAGPLPIPDVALLDQYGRQVQFYQDLIKDKVVAINFIFTTCSTVCLPAGAHFEVVQRLLGNRMGRDIHLISVSVDPVTDTPPRLRAWGEKFHAGPGWILLTGAKSKVDTLLKALQVFTPDKQEHTPLVLVGNDATGTWTRAYGLVAPATLAALLSSVSGSATQTSTTPEER